jgi:hypothetical protein
MLPQTPSAAQDSAVREDVSPRCIAKPARGEIQANPSFILMATVKQLHDPKQGNFAGLPVLATQEVTSLANTGKPST